MQGLPGRSSTFSISYTSNVETDYVNNPWLPKAVCKHIPTFQTKDCVYNLKTDRQLFWTLLGKKLMTFRKVYFQKGTFYPNSHIFYKDSVNQSLSHIQLFAIPWTVTHQAELSMDSPSKNTRLDCHSLLQRIYPNPGIEPVSPAFQADSLPFEPQVSLQKG